MICVLSSDRIFTPIDKPWHGGVFTVLSVQIFVKVKPKNTTVPFEGISGFFRGNTSEGGRNSLLARSMIFFAAFLCVLTATAQPTGLPSTVKEPDPKTYCRLTDGVVLPGMTNPVFNIESLDEGNSSADERNHKHDVACKISVTNVLVHDFEGWGSSLCWWAHVVSGFSNRDVYASLAFDTLGLNIVRYNIGGGERNDLNNYLPFRARIPGFQPAPGNWDWDADRNQRWMLHYALKHGASKVVAFANSPPWWMTVSGSVTGTTNGVDNNLKVENEKAFIDYFVTVVSNLTILDKIKFDAVTPVNEPSAAWWTYGHNQEGCHIDDSQQARLVKLLRESLINNGLSGVKICASEENRESETVATLNAFDSVALRDVDLIVTHTYAPDDPSGLERLRARTGKPLWVSEYGDADATGLKMAQRIRDDIIQTKARAWIYWQVVDNCAGWGFLNNPLDGEGDGRFSINQKFYVMWQFSHFIRPGCQILNVSEPHSLVAYNLVDRTLVIIAVNDSSNGVYITYDLDEFSPISSHAGIFRTSCSGEKGNYLGSIQIKKHKITLPVKAMSVTSMIVSNVVVMSPNRP